MRLFLNAVKYLLMGFGLIVLEQIPTVFITKNQPIWRVLAISLALLIITGLVYYLAYRFKLVDYFKILRNPSAWKTIIIGILALFLVKILGGIVLVLEHGANANTSNQSVIESLGMNPILLVILTVIVAPIVEEITCRGIIQGLAFKNSYLGVLVSSLIFGGLHVPTDLGSWIIYGGMGLVLGLIYRKTQKLEYSMTIHFLNNALGVIFMLLAM